jgi:von Willebrand factor type A domain
MKTIRNTARQFPCIFGFVLTAMLLMNCQPARSESTANPGPDPDKQTIMLALLLDTSNSMDGLIDQAKSQLWKIVNELSEAKCDDGSRPNIRIALYEYGNDGLPSSEGYIRQVSPLTNDLDLISEKLFSLTTNGGNEFCGNVIRTSLQQLEWTTTKADLKMIFIAGNEPFTQGPVPFQTACELAKEKGVVVNSIYCGSFDDGLNSSWKRGSDITGGSYMSIDQNRRTVYVATPYDDKIDALNDQLNSTYLYYGKTGTQKKANQAAQDNNAEHYGKANKVERAVSKSSSAYSNSSWDLVDATKDDARAIEKAQEETLPAEMKSMTIEQRKVYIKKKSDERTRIQAEIQKLNEERKSYQQKNKPAESSEGSLDDTMIKAIKTQAKTKRLSW